MTRIEHPDDPDRKQVSNNTILFTLYFILAGFIFGLGFHTYISFRIAPLILMPVFLYTVIQNWKTAKLRIIGLWVLFGIAMIIAATPIIIYFLGHPQDFMGRTGQVSVLASTNPLKGLTISAAKSLGMFNVSGDCNWRHNYACQPALPMPVGLLFLVGLFLCLISFLKPIWNSAWRQKIIRPENFNFWWFSFFLLVWFKAMLLPEILTNEGLPHSLRAIGAIPSVYIFAGLGGFVLYAKIKFLIEKKFSTNPRALKGWGAGITAFYIAFFLALILSAYQIYFIDWGKNPIVKGAFTQNLVDLGNYINSLPTDAQKYVIVNEGGVPVPYPNGIPMPAQTVMFIARNAQNVSYLKPEGVDRLQISDNQPQIFLPLKYDDMLAKQLKQKFPNGKIIEENSIWTFQVNN